MASKHPVSALLLPAIVFCSAISGAQVPAQFKGLLTTKTDYTCAGDVPCPTWPMPANPGMGNSYSDPTWGTTTWELNIPSQNTEGAVIPIYSRNQGFSSDNKRLLLQEPDGRFTDLYDATTTPPTPINRIATTDGTFIDTSAGDAYWANTVPTRIYYIPWESGTSAGLQLRYVDVTNCTTSNCTLKPTTVHTFSCVADSYAPSPIKPGTRGTVIESSYTGSQGNMFDLTDTYFSFSCDIEAADGHAEVDLIRYNRNTDSVTTQVKWYTVCAGGVPSGCYIWSNPSGEMPHQGYNMFRMAQHPDANYITIAWMCYTDLNTNWKIGCGTAAYGPTYNYLGPISVENVHQDNGFDINGIPTWVGQNTSIGTPPDQDYFALEVVNLATLSTSGVTSKQLLLPCSWLYKGTPCPAYPFLGAKFLHISMTGTWGSVPGYALVSTGTEAGKDGSNVDMPLATTLGTAISNPGVATVTPGTMANIGVGTQQLIDWHSANVETVTVTSVTPTAFTATFKKSHTATAPVSNLSAGDTGPYAMENIAVKIDTKAASGSAAQIWRLGRVMSIRGGDYNAEAHTFVNRDWTAYVWGSNWNSDGGKVYGFWTKLPRAVPKASDASASPGAKPE
jgi:hypothetical protein